MIDDDRYHELASIIYKHTLLSFSISEESHNKWNSP